MVTEAACRGLPEVFAAKPFGDEVTMVQRVCKSCPVLEQCRAFADENNVYGVYGGGFHQHRWAA